MVDKSAGGANKMLAGPANIKHGGNKKDNQTENKKIKGNPPGHRRFPETAIRFKMLCWFHWD
jgi:hypothetical protein